MALDDSFRVNKDLIVGGSVYANVSSTSAFFDVTDTSTQILSAGVDLLDIFGGSGGGTTVINTSGGGSAGAFVTDITCPGIVTLTKDTTQVEVDGQTPVLSAEVDDPIVTFTLQWEGMADTWTGYPVISSTAVTQGDTDAIGTNVRRYEGDVTLDLTSFAGTTIDVPYVYDGLNKSVTVTIAGAGPEIMEVRVTGSEPFGQDHYKDGDTIELTVRFNTTDVDTISLFDSGAATGTVTDQSVTMNGLSATFTTQINTSVTSRTLLPVKISAKNAFGTAGSVHTSGNIVDCLAGPEIVNIVPGPLPGSQVEAKLLDTISATFTFDTTNVDRIGLVGNNDNSLASATQQLTVNTGGTNVATTNILIHTTLAANTGGVNGTGGENRPIKARAKKNGHHSNFGNFHTSAATVTVNNQAPTFSPATITYPAGQQAIDETQSATVNIVISNQGATTGGADYTYSSPGGQLTIPDPTVYDVSGDKVVSVNPTFTSFNVTSNNYQIAVVRPENDKSAVTSALIKIIVADPTLTASVPASRLRSGGNAGTSTQIYTITVVSNQPLLSFDMDAATSGGTLSNANWSSSSDSKTWTNQLVVSDNDNKGNFNWANIAAEDLTTAIKTTLDSGSQYTLGGFVVRDLTLPSLSRTVAIGTNVSNTSKLVASETFRGTITFDSSIANGVTLNPDLNTGVNVTSKYTIVNASSPNVVDHNGDTFFYLDRTAAANNVSGTSNINIRENI